MFIIASDESPIRAGTYRSSYRAGRLGPSENVVQVTGNLGNNLAFINPMPKSERGEKLKRKHTTLMLSYNLALSLSFFLSTTQHIIHKI